MFSAGRNSYRRHGRAPIINEWLSAVTDTDVRALAQVFIIGTLIVILKATPSAHVVNEYRFEVSRAALNIGNQVLKRVSTLDVEPAFPIIGIRADDLHLVELRKAAVHRRLILHGVLLVLSRHAHVLRALWSLSCPASSDSAPLTSDARRRMAGAMIAHLKSANRLGRDCVSRPTLFSHSTTRHEAGLQRGIKVTLATSRAMGRAFSA